jgi:hypothetical protein
VPTQEEEPNGNLTITILDEFNQPLESVQVVCISGPGDIHNITGITDENGTVSFSNLERGDYKFVSIQEGFTNRTINANLGASMERDKTVGLNPEYVAPDSERQEIPWYNETWPLLISIIIIVIMGYAELRLGLSSSLFRKAEEPIEIEIVESREREQLSLDDFTETKQDKESDELD